MLAIIAAFKDEVSDYLRGGRFRVTNKEGRLKTYESEKVPNVVVLEGGVGKDLARAATQLAVERYAPELVLAAGFAAGARAGMDTGDLFVCDRLAAMEGPAYLWGRSDVRETRDLRVQEWFTANVPGGPAYRFVGCLSVPQLVSNASMKAWLGRTFDVSLIDMECYWVNQTAADMRVPSISVRAMLDPVEQALPGFVGEAVERGAGERVLRAAAYLSTNPRQAPRLLGLRKQASVARKALADFLGRIVSARTD